MGNTHNKTIHLNNKSIVIEQGQLTRPLKKKKRSVTNYSEARNKKIIIRSIFISSFSVPLHELKTLANYQFCSLTTLNLGQKNINDEGAKRLANCSFPSLFFLYLHSNRIRAKGMQHLSEGQLKSLQSLHLDKNKISSEGVKYIINYANLNIGTVYLRYNNIFQQMKQIMQSFQLKSKDGALIYLYL